MIRRIPSLEGGEQHFIVKIDKALSKSRAQGGAPGERGSPRVSHSPRWAPWGTGISGTWRGSGRRAVVLQVGTHVRMGSEWGVRQCLLQAWGGAGASFRARGPTAGSEGL